MKTSKKIFDEKISHDCWSKERCFINAKIKGRLHPAMKQYLWEIPMEEFSTSYFCYFYLFLATNNYFSILLKTNENIALPELSLKQKVQIKKWNLKTTVLLENIWSSYFIYYCKRKNKM